ncbi:hypothetical protein [Desulfohalobium retbaense]|uniref:Uncharacterized protein n=1 Tax=Desulfohalobium retbaense (strain ATCC 49708 / DSM 5692 / JCM 16813 / HR100) TaxID=485915 RepID=C8X0R8_DESRD|nr:hypothetical protein [Desulfohalobium retbaense]ACV68015.1 hypothetical protein Dret_0723 [Desulfohalobium retbaense DSM 5692]
MRCILPRLMSHLVVPVVVLAFVALLSGMGSSSTKIVRQVPEPDRSFTVVIRDVAARSYEVDHFSIQGVTYLPAQLGKAKLGIDFNRIARVDMLDQGEAFSARIRFQDGTRQEVQLEPDITFTGQSKWGPIELSIGDIYSFEFQTE